MTTGRVTIVHVRDPDSTCYIQTFIDGQEVEHDEFDIDAGRGWDEESWQQAMEDSVAVAVAIGPEVAEAVAVAYGDPPGDEYIQGRVR